MKQSHQHHQQQQRWVIDSFCNLYTEENSTFESCDINNAFYDEIYDDDVDYDHFGDDDGVDDDYNDGDGDDKDDDACNAGDVGDAGFDDNNATCLPMGKLGNLTKLLFLALAAVSI